MFIIYTFFKTDCDYKIKYILKGNSNYLPVQEHVAFLFDLMELALNVNSLLDVCIQVNKSSNYIFIQYTVFIIS